MTKTERKHYIDKEKFNEETVKYVNLYNDNVENGLPKPQMNNYLGSCIILLANKVSCMPAFNNYPFRDEMISDAIEICVRYFHKYDENAISKRTGEKTAGAFAYFTQAVARRMFKRRAEEKVQMYLRQKLIVHSEESFQQMQMQDEKEHVDILNNILEEMSGDDYVEYDLKLAAKKKELKAKKALKVAEAESLISDEDIEEEMAKLPLSEFFNS